MIEINGKTYRNLPEQVEKNMDDIEKLKNYYPFSGPYATTDDIPEDLLIDTGKYLIGANEPYSIYQYVEADEDFIDLGTFADPEDYISKTAGVTGITGKKEFTINDTSGAWGTDKFTINNGHGKALTLYGTVGSGYAADYNETNINASNITMHGMGQGTQDFGSTQINCGYISLAKLPYVDGTNIIQLDSRYGNIGVYTRFDNEQGSGIGYPYGILRKNELIFATGINGDPSTNISSTYYSAGGVDLYRPDAFGVYDIDIINKNNHTHSDFIHTHYKFKYKTDGGSFDVATIDDIKAKVPDAPTVDGTYTLKVTVSNGTPTYSWVLDN